MADRKKFVHVLISASYFSHVPLTSAVFTEMIRKVMRDAPTIEPERIITYQMSYSLNPAQCGLKDNWDRMLDEERKQFSDRYPQLATAIALMCTDNEVVSGGDDGKARSTSSAKDVPVQGSDNTRKNA